MSDMERGPAPVLTLLPKPSPDSFPPEHARNTKRDPDRVAVVAVKVGTLFEILEQLKTLAPCHRSPERFHERKDELCAQLYDLATRPSLVLEA